MNLELSHVSNALTYKVVGGLASYFDTAAEYSAGRATSADILRTIMTGQYQLWVLLDRDSNRMHGFFVTEFRNYPQRRMLVVQHVVLDAHLMALIEGKMQDVAAAYARENGCAGVEFVGRPGWKKHAEQNGYTLRSVTYEKMFEEKS